jgi:hypothetical protein
MVSISDLADRAPRALADGERLLLGQHAVRWLDAPHLPHAWECGFLTEERTATLLCGDLLTQGGASGAAMGPRSCARWPRRSRPDGRAHGLGRCAQSTRVSARSAAGVARCRVRGTSRTAAHRADRRS